MAEGSLYCDQDGRKVSFAPAANIEAGASPQPRPRTGSKWGLPRLSMPRFSSAPRKISSGVNGMALYEDDTAVNMPYLSTYLRSLGGVAEQPSTSGHGGNTKLGTLLGVYLPSIQHILGVQMFLRLLWVVGIAGVTESVVMVFVCCLCTFLTSISISAIATNGKIDSGGAYFMISRNLGPEFGGAIGVLFYLANTIAAAMYLIGGVEILLVYMAPGLKIFGTADDEAAMFNNFRVYGTVFLLVVFAICAGGVRLVQLFGPVSLAAVVLSILAVFVGSFVARPDRGPMICMLGDRLILPEAYTRNGTPECNKTMNSALWSHYCDINGTCDSHFLSNNVRYVAGIPGFASGVINDNAWPVYLSEDESSPGNKGNGKVEVTQDMSTNWFILLAIFFPSVTGIMTGANMSGDLKDPQSSIPLGTIAAQLTTSIIYLALVLCYGGVVEGALLRDKFGTSIHGSMLVAQLAWPNEWVLLVGSFLACIGAGLQCLCNDLIPFLGIFRTMTKRGEPFKALLITALLAECGVLIGTIDYIAPIVDFFFLMSYCFANIACTLQTLLRAPNWRPRFKYYHWSLSLLGALLCLFIMFATYWYYGIVVVVLCAALYKYIEYKGAKKEWGDGMRGLALSTAQYSLLKTEGKETHPKNWRPQILVLLKPEENEKGAGQQLLNLAGQLKAGQGLTMAASLLKGDIGNPDDRDRQARMRLKIRQMMKEAKVKGFVEAVLTENVSANLASVIQCVGMGALRPNTIMLAWPQNWRQTSSFYDAIQCAASAEMCLLLPKGLERFPEIRDQLTGTIDVWWIMHDGGLLILLPFLLRQHRVWRGCKLRVFAVAQIGDNVPKMKEDLQKWVYHLRIDCAVDVITLPDNAVDAYTNDRTLAIAERMRLASALQLNLKNLSQEPQMLADVARYGNSIGDYFKEKTTPTGTVLKNLFTTVEEDENSSSFDEESQTKQEPREVQSKTTLFLDVPRTSIAAPSMATRPSLADILSTASANRRQSLFHSFKNPAFEPDDDNAGKKVIGSGKVLRKWTEITEASEDETETETETEPSTDSLTFEDDTVAQEPKETLASTPEPKVEGRFSIKPHSVETDVKPREDDEHKKSNLRKMHTALRLNRAIKEQSKDSRLIILNLPRPPGSKSYFHVYMAYLEALTKDLQRVLLVRGSGKEVITIYS